MSERAFYLPESKASVTASIREVESGTSAELVVAVKHTSGDYRDLNYLVGFAVALSTLCAVLFLPTSFAVWAMPIDVLVGFVVGAFATSNAPALRRLLLSGRRAEAAVQSAASSAFVARGISRTKGRNGVLVFVSTFERKVACLPDIGIDITALGDPWRVAQDAMRDAVSRLDFEGFVRALRSLGPPLGTAMPHQADDVNELPDEVVES
jgi:putative membrane protein